MHQIMLAPKAGTLPWPASQPSRGDAGCYGRPSASEGGAIRHAAACRWRHGLVERAAGAPCLWSPSDELGACGDGCPGGRIEAAVLGGAALAARVLEDLA
jgi:hypothetical protein